MQSYFESLVGFLLIGANKDVRIAGSSMWLTDLDGDEIQLTILVPANLG